MFLLSALLRSATLGIALAMAGSTPAFAKEPLAKSLFGAEKLPSAGKAQSFGFYSKGCFSGGVGLEQDGAHWQVMRPSRNRRWGHPAMVRLLHKLAEDGARVGWNGLLVGDISQPRGGPMLSGHASHQIGLDADIWLTPMPSRRLSAEERESVPARSVLKPNSLYVDDSRWTAAHQAILKTAAGYPEVERILVHPGIKKKLCDTVKSDRAWLRKIRPFWGHDAHFHVRIGCQAGSPQCKEQAATAPGDGCDKSLAWWFTDEPWRPSKNPDAPKARDVMTMNALPQACVAVLDAPAAGAPEPVVAGGDSGTKGVSKASAAGFPSLRPLADIPVPQPRPDGGKR